MQVVLSKTFRVEAAHKLPRVPEGHKCRRLHGHSYRIEISVRGEVDSDSGWYIDFKDIEENFRPLLKQLDHSYLNEIEGLENPTSENLARWIWQRLQGSLRGLHKIVIMETPDSRCEYMAG